MEGFVTRQNIEHYRSMLQITTDLAVMEKLPREEEAKSKKYDEDHKRNRRLPARRLDCVVA